MLITGENNYSNIVTLNKSNNWTVTIDNLALGKYVIEELLTEAKIEDYNLKVNYSNGTNSSNNKIELTLAETNLKENITVTNTYTKKTGSLVITKEVEYKLNDEIITSPSNKDYTDETYSFTVIIGENNYEISLKAGESKTFENIPYGTNYQVIENIPSDAKWLHTSPTNATGNINLSEEKVNMINTYNFESIEISTKKEWHNVENINHPTSVEVTLYRNGIAHDTKILSDKNDWTYTWGNLTTEYNWTVDEINVPSGYTKKIEKTGNNYIITNTYHGVPQTSDETNISLYTIITLIGLIGLIITKINYKKNYS